MSEGSFPDPIDLNEFRDFGYLAEANRQFFHPLGLALFVQFDDDDEPVALGVFDDRADLEGWYMVEVDDDLRAKAARVAAERDRRDPVRLAALGYVVQPLAAEAM